MANTVTAAINGGITASITPDVGWFRNATKQVTAAIKSGLVAGTALDQCDVAGFKLFTLAVSTPTVVDLLADLVDPISGVAITTLARVRGLVVKIEGTTDGSSCIMAADTTNGFSNLVSTGGIILLPATAKNSAGLVLSAPNSTGYVVSASNKRLKFTPSAHSFDVRLLVIGASV